MNNKILKNLQKCYYSEEPKKQRDYQKNILLRKIICQNKYGKLCSWETKDKMINTS